MRRLTTTLPPVSHPSWSADGRRLAFNAGPPTTSDIYLIDADGSGLTQVTRDAAANFYPSWSPDGRRLAFSSNGDGDWDVYVMDAAVGVSTVALPTFAFRFAGERIRDRLERLRHGILTHGLLITGLLLGACGVFLIALGLWRLFRG